MRNLKWLGLALACAALPASGSAFAQDMGQDAEIVITGQREVTREQAQHYVRQIASTVEDQMTRFRDPICPMLIGLPDQYRDVVIARIRRVAGRAGAPVAPAKCRPNVVVIIAADADQLVRDMRKKLPRAFFGLSNGELSRALREGPVHVWNASEIRNDDNHKPANSTITTVADKPTLYVRSASIITLPTQQVTVQSVIVVDSKAMLGKTLMQISDYVTMRTLAAARPPAGEGLPGDTILSLFDPGASAPPSMTFLDATYLEALYHTRANQRAVAQMNEISRHIGKRRGAKR